MPNETNTHTHTHTHKSYQSFSLLLHGAQQLRELLQWLSCKISYSTNLCNASLSVVMLIALLCFALLCILPMLISSSVSASPIHSNWNSCSDWEKRWTARERPEKRAEKGSLNLLKQVQEFMLKLTRVTHVTSESGMRLHNAITAPAQCNTWFNVWCEQSASPCNKLYFPTLEWDSCV